MCYPWYYSTQAPPSFHFGHASPRLKRSDIRSDGRRLGGVVVILRQRQPFRRTNEYHWLKTKEDYCRCRRHTFFSKSSCVTVSYPHEPHSPGADLQEKRNIFFTLSALSYFLRIVFKAMIVRKEKKHWQCFLARIRRSSAIFPFVKSFMQLSLAWCVVCQVKIHFNSYSIESVEINIQHPTQAQTWKQNAKKKKNYLEGYSTTNRKN